MFPSRYVLALAGLSASPVEAAPSDGSMDGGFDGDIQEISVTAVKSEDRALRPAQVLDKAHISRINPIALSDIFRTVMGVGIRTNSRGDAVLRLRGSEERQSQIFVDGAPISVPWDGRADLSLFPASLIKNISIIKGAAPIEYGANAALGVIDISTLESGDEVGLGGRVETGSHSAMMIEGETYIPLENNVGLQLGFNYHNRDAISVANRQTIPFDPLTGEGRTNTDLESASVFAAASMERDWGSFRLSTTDISAEKGIAAAAHIDPAVGNPRFWRYPDWDLTQLSLAGEIDINDRTNLRFNAWQQWFAQTIVSYTNATYSTARSRQEDEDKTFGSRAVLSSNWAGFTTRIVASTQQSTHQQIENNLETNTAGLIETFRQRLSSIGGEIDIPAGLRR